jgi:ABC-type multidrug transport system fused ATPase/permease subunit
MFAILSLGDAISSLAGGIFNVITFPIRAIIFVVQAIQWALIIGVILLIIILVAKVAKKVRKGVRNQKRQLAMERAEDRAFEASLGMAGGGGGGSVVIESEGVPDSRSNDAAVDYVSRSRMSKF